MSQRRIVCDIDDTICFTTNRDWENATPKIEVIEKINKLYDEGWEIYLVTARGQVSCKGDPVKAEQKYGEGIRTWLKKHGVNYHVLSFQKFLASYYVDDKGLTPEAFVNLDIERFRDGRSGSVVERHGSRVYKTFPEQPKALAEATWYNLVDGMVTIPKLHSVIDRTICIEYVKSILKTPSLDFIKETLLKFRSVSYYPEKKFSDYIDEVSRNHEATLIEILGDRDFFLNDPDRKSEVINMNRSFCHGDFTLENILVTEEGKHYLIDPIFKKDSFSSWLLDASKMLHSMRKYNKPVLFESLFSFVQKNTGMTSREIYLMEFLHWIRIYKYAHEDEKEFIKETILELKREYL